MKATRQKKSATSPPPDPSQNREPTHDEIARQAYSLWEHQGRPQHCEVAIWLQAEAQLRQLERQHDPLAEGCLAAQATGTAR